MTLGTGILLAAIWLMPSAAYLSKTTSGAGVWISLAVAVGMTLLLK